MKENGETFGKKIPFGMCREALDNATQSYGSPLLPVFIGPNDLISIMR